jgi:hypothetical protein
LTLSQEEIVQEIDQMDRDSKALKHEALRLCWYMRGGINYDDSMMLSFSEREMIGKIVEDNMKTTKESGLPFF